MRRCGPATRAIRSRISRPARPVDSSAARQTSAGETPSPMPVSATRFSLSPRSSIPPASAGAASAARSSSPRSPPSRSSTRCSAAPERSAPSRHWRPSTACQPTLMPSATAAPTRAGSSGATARMNASAVPQETSTSPSPVAPAPTAALKWSWPPTASTASRIRGRRSPARPAGVVAGAGCGSSPGGAPDHACASSHQPRAWTSSQPVRDASDSSLTRSPPSRCTIHSAPLSQRAPCAVSGRSSRSQRYLTSEHSGRGASPVRSEKRSVPMSAISRATCSAPRESCHAIAGATGSPRASSSTPVSAKLATPSAPIGPSGAPSSASRAAASAASTSRSGAISAPLGTRSHGTRARPWDTSRPPWLTTAALQEVVPRSRPSSSGSTSCCLAAGLVERVLALLEVVLGDRDRLGADLRRRLLVVQSLDGLLDALRADVGRLLRDQRLHVALLELLDPGGPGVEADDLHVARLACLAHAAGRALGGEQVRREDALDVRVLGELGLDDRGCALRLVLREVLPEVLQAELLGALLEALRTGVGGQRRSVAHHAPSPASGPGGRQRIALPLERRGAGGEWNERRGARAQLELVSALAAQRTGAGDRDEDRERRLGRVPRLHPLGAEVRIRRRREQRAGRRARERGRVGWRAVGGGERRLPAEAEVLGARVDAEAAPLDEHRQVGRLLQLEQQDPVPIACSVPAGTSSALPRSASIRAPPGSKSSKPTSASSSSRPASASSAPIVLRLLALKTAVGRRSAG